jgi:uncharacterized protein YqcC (DUF446 family)
MTTAAAQELTDKITEVCQEMQRLAHWQHRAPRWVYQYGQSPEKEVGFDEWLQFVYLPNLLQQAQHPRVSDQSQSLAPQAIKFLGEEVQRGKLLQLLIELDSLL